MAAPLAPSIGPEFMFAAPRIYATRGAVLNRPVVLTHSALAHFIVIAPRAARERSARMFLTFNKSDDANRVQDILTALAWLNKPKTLLLGLGKAGVWTLFAAAVSHQPVELRADLSHFDGTDEDYIANFFVPGIQRAGGLQAALELAGLR